MPPNRRDLLEAVAAGRVSPEEAAQRLSEMAADATTGAREPEPDDLDSGHREQGTGLRLLRVEASAVPVRIVGDRNVREVDVAGPHRVRRDGDVLVVEHDLDDVEADGGSAFAFVVDGRQRHVDLGRAIRHGRRRPLAIRANPDTELEVACSAGSLSISGMRSAITLDVSAGSVRLDDLRGPLKARINAGSLRARGQLTSGSSRIECDAGSVRLSLEPGSSVRLAVETHLGRSEIRTAGARPAEGARSGVDAGRLGLDGGRRELVIGDGAGELEVLVNMGSVRIDAS